MSIVDDVKISITIKFTNIYLIHDDDLQFGSLGP